MSDRVVYLASSDYEAFLTALKLRTGVHIPQAVIVEEDGPLFYRGPIDLDYDGDAREFIPYTHASPQPGREVMPSSIDGWKEITDPWKRFITLAENGYYRVMVYDTLPEASE